MMYFVLSQKWWNTFDSRLLAAEIFDKLKAMEHHASPSSSLIWLWLLVSFGEPLVSFVMAFPEGRSDYRFLTKIS